MTIELWESRDLYQLLRDDRLDPVPDYFLNTFFTESYYSDDQKIKFGKLPKARRVLAPFVLPTEQGKPIFSRKGETVTDILPPYIKPKDVVRAEDARNVLPSEVFRNGGQRPSLQQRFDARVAEIAAFHRRAIQMQKAWMAARAMLDAKIQIDYARDQGAEYPSVLLDFGRDPNHTITLTSGSTWDDADTPILDNLESWMNMMYLADQGGSASLLLVGAQVAQYFEKNKQVLDMLDTNIRGGESVQIDRGILRTEQPYKEIGRLDSGLVVATYRDQVENANGAMVDLMDPRDILLVAPGAIGVDAHGAIMDDEATMAGMNAIDIFPKMWPERDPGATYIMHQSAPLPIPLYPNRTVKARVLI